MIGGYEERGARHEGPDWGTEAVRLLVNRAVTKRKTEVERMRDLRIYGQLLDAVTHSNKLANYLDNVTHSSIYAPSPSAPRRCRVPSDAYGLFKEVKALNLNSYLLHLPLQITLYPI
jgi:hypothetical protein